MARDEGHFGLDRPVAVDGMEIGMTDAAGDYLDEYLVQTWFFYGHFFYLKGLTEGMDDGSFHFFW
jgi:hypothetical protein